METVRKEVNWNLIKFWGFKKHWASANTNSNCNQVTTQKKHK